VVEFLLTGLPLMASRPALSVMFGLFIADFFWQYLVTKDVIAVREVSHDRKKNRD
jgi:hypothetical protein